MIKAVHVINFNKQMSGPTNMMTPICPLSKFICRGIVLRETNISMSE